MATNTIKTRIQLKNDTEAHWNLAVNFVPKEGEVIIYSADDTHPFSRLKVGNGNTTVSNLPFIDAATLNGSKIEIGSTVEWQARLNYIPKRGDILIYTDKETLNDNTTVPGIKIGDGLAYGIDLPFVGTDTKVTNTAVTAATTYYLTGSTNSSTVTGELNKHASIKAYVTANSGTSGYARLDLGNTTATTTAGGKEGILRLYGTTQTYYIDLKAGAPSANRTITFPNATGTVALTTDIPDISGKIDTAGTGLSKSGTTLNHSNSVTAQNTQAIYPIKIDTQGHISSYGTAVTLGAAAEKNVTDNSSNTDVTSSDTNLITGRTLYYQLAKKGYTTNTGTVTSITLKAGTGISLDVDNTAITTSGTRTITNTGVTSIGGLTGAVSLSDLGLSQALKFRGITTTTMTDPYIGTPAITGLTYTPAVGDVVIDSSSNSEYVCISVSGTTYTWERLGRDDSFKIIQTAISDPIASGTSTSFISTISQDTNGTISVTKANLPNYLTTIAWDSINKKLTQTVYNNSPTDVVTAATLKTALELNNVSNNSNLNNTTGAKGDIIYWSSTDTPAHLTNTSSTTKQALTITSQTPSWVNISPSITIESGTSSAAPTVNVTVLGVSGTAKSITTASTSIYGVTKLQDGISSTSTTLAATANAAYTASRNSLHTLETTTKFYFTGCSSNTTNTAGDIFDTGIYTTTTAGELSAVRHTLNYSGTDKAYMIWNNTDQSIDFIFN